tara:strand:- start:7121 stop:8497 length:1377 start_codon:yes stop_codon:yes gene_type:complete
MNRLLPGKIYVKKISYTSVAFFSGMLLLAVLLPCAGNTADNEKDRVSGVVKPKVSVLSPSQTLDSTKPVIEEYIFPEKYSVPHGLAIDSKDRIWVTEAAGNSLAMFDPATKQLKEYRIPSTKGLPEIEWEYDPKKKETPKEAVTIYSVGSPGNVIVDQNDVIWFVMHLGNSVVRFDPVKEEFTEYIIPIPNAQPYDLAADSKGRIWFVEKNSGNLSYIDLSNQKTYEINMGKGSNMMGIAIDSEDNIWVGDVTGNQIVRYNPSTKKLRKFPINVPLAQPGQMRFDEDGKLWFCSLRTKKLGVLMPDPGVISFVDLPGYNSTPQALTIGKDNEIWIVDSFLNQVGYFDQVALTWHLFDIQTSNSTPMNIDIDSNGDIWFTESARKSNRIAKLISSTMPDDEESSTRSEQAVFAEAEKEQTAKTASPKKSKSINLYAVAGVLIAAIIVVLIATRKYVQSK